MAVYQDSSSGISGNIIAMSPFNAPPETVVTFDGMEIKWHASSLTSLDGIAIRCITGSKILRYSTIEIYNVSAAVDNGKSLWGSTNVWYSLPNTLATAGIINAVYPHAQTVGTTFLGIGNPGLTQVGYRQYYLYNDTDLITYKITINKLATTGETLVVQNGSCTIIVEKLGTKTNQVITAGAGIAINNGAISTTAGTITRVNVICRNKTTQSLPSSAWTILTNWTVVQDSTSSFNATTGVFTAPRTSSYQFSTGNGTPILAGGNYFGQSIWLNGTTQLYNFLTTAGAAVTHYPQTSGVIEMTVGQTLQARTFNGGAIGNDSPSPSNSWFTITEINNSY